MDDKKDYVKITWNDLEDDSYKNKMCETAQINLHGNTCDFKLSMIESLADTESPIEQVMAIELARIGAVDNFYYFNPKIDVLGLEKQAVIECESKKYRVDFLIPVCYRINGSQHLKQFVIECDGYEYHERTKKQINARNERDRILNRNGYIVLHYSGSEIIKSGVSCARDVVRTILKGGEEYGCV